MEESHPFFAEEYSNDSFKSLDSRNEVLKERQFEGCIFHKCNFSAAVLKSCRFIECQFEQCELSNMQVRNCVFRDVSFKDCKLIGVNWALATTLSHLYFEGSTLNYANFVGLDFRKSSFRECIAKESDFSEANLSEVDFRGTDFSGARFSNSNLVKADFRGSLNYAINPTENKIKGARFSLPEATLLLYGLGIVLEE